MDELSRKAGQDLFHNHPVIFVPNSSSGFESSNKPVAGRMLGRADLWWADPTDLFFKYRDSLSRYKSPLAKIKIVSFHSV